MHKDISWSETWSRGLWSTRTQTNVAQKEEKKNLYPSSIRKSNAFPSWNRFDKITYHISFYLKQIMHSSPFELNTLSSFPQVFPLLSNYSEVINWSCFLHPPMSHGSSNWSVLPTNLYWFDYISSSAYPNSDLEVGPNNLVNIKRVFEYWGQQLSSVHLVNDHTQTSLMLQYLPKTNTNDEIGIDRYDEID